MEHELQKLLFSKGVSFRYKGYCYFTRAVLLAVEDPSRLQNIQKEIYAPIAEELGKSIQCIEKSLRTIRDVFMQNNGAELLLQMTGGTIWEHKNPYPSEMIEIFTFYFINKYR